MSLSVFFLFLRNVVLLIFRFPFPFSFSVSSPSMQQSSSSSVFGGTFSLHATDEDGVDGKDILGEFLDTGIRRWKVCVNHVQPGMMEVEDILEEVEGKPAKSVSVGNHNLRDQAPT